MKHILVVDDAATVRLYHRGILEGAGFTVQEAANGAEALEKAIASVALRPFDLYVVDVNMPVMDGYAFLQALRGADVPQAPALMASTEAEDGDRARAFAAGANAYAVKPLRPEQLIREARLLMGVAA
ncbi:response regulator [Pseudoduganella armeniaca]|uniref:Response regulator n=1 Tax=Pseudoduganella armeniaca TaxID=2072590 RepID=A0A2R4CG80_9BURK|nr:response regulator [Pseudoduganella armeniaca]AVR98634.1 response regulator [Pseudoduganella armeniaca]